MHSPRKTYRTVHFLSRYWYLAVGSVFLFLSF